MAGLSFMESFALGYMAAGSGPDWGATLSGIHTDYRYKQALAQADVDYATLVNEYNRLVDSFNALSRHGETMVARQNQRITQLEQTIANATPLAAELERRAVAAEQRAAAAVRREADLARREAETRQNMADFQEDYRNARNLLAVHAAELGRAKTKIARLEAIVAGMSKPPEQDTPAPDAPGA